MSIISNCKNYIYSLDNQLNDFLYFKMNKSLSPTFMSNCFGILALELINEIDSVPNLKRDATINFFNQHQDIKTGLYLDPLITIKVPERNILMNNYLHLQTTSFVLSTIDSLGGEPKYEFNFLNEYRDKERALGWINSLNWENAWSVSNDVMFFLQFLSYEASNRNNRKSDEIITICFDWLDANQDPKTGFWGTNKGASIYNGMAGAFHILIFYHYFNRKINFIEKIIDNTLALQVRDGLFYPMGGGGACEDLDAIDILIKCSKLTDYKKIEIKKRLKKAFDAILKLNQLDGGFVWAIRPKHSILNWFKFSLPFHKTWSYTQFKFILMKAILCNVFSKYKSAKDSEFLAYSGWERMRFKICESDIWSTWFRMLALALINERYHFSEELNNVTWRYRNYPGLGWHKK